jgi:hypothetical protein
MMDSIEDSIGRHPAGKKLEDIHDTVWAISKSAELARKAEQERIIKLLEESDSVCNDWAIALIKGDNDGS